MKSLEKTSFIISSHWIEEEFAAAIKANDTQKLVQLWNQVKHWQDTMEVVKYEIKKEINQLQKGEEKKLGWDRY